MFHKFSDRLVLANSADPDQTAPSVLTICNTVCIFWMHYSMVKPLFFPNLGWLEQSFLVSENLGTLQYLNEEGC